MNQRNKENIHMANLQVKDIDDSLYNSLKQRAASERRSVSQEVVLIIEKYLSSPDQFDKNPTKDFLQLSGSWIDEKSADEIINDIQTSRKNSSRFENGNELFD
jgi:plasmid stability protein